MTTKFHNLGLHNLQSKKFKCDISCFPVNVVNSNMLHQLLSFMIFKSNQRFLRNILIEHQDVGFEPVGSTEQECALVLFLVPSLGGLGSQPSALVCFT